MKQSDSGCYTEIQFASYLDGEMPGVEAHLLECAACRQVVSALRDESESLTAALGEPLDAPDWLRVRPPSAPVLVRDLSLTAVLWLLFQWLPEWNYLRGIVTLLLPEILRSARWLDRLAMGLLWAVAIGAIGYLLSRRRQIYKVAALLVIAIVSIPVQAMTRRADHNVVLVQANETVDDSLVAAGDTVRIEGTVNGDLIAFARRVEVRGTVKGSLISFSQNVDVRGAVEGNVYAFGQTLDFGGSVGRSVYAGAESVNFGAGSRVGFEVLVAGERLLGRGAIARDLAFFGSEMNLEEPAKVSGKVSAHVDDKRRVKVAAGVASGPVEIRERRPRWQSPWFYLGELLAFAGALVVAWVGWRFTPRFLAACVQSASAWWRSIAVGAIAAVTIPVAVVLAAITRVGLPLAAITLGFFLVLLYAAKIVIGAYIGKALLPGRHFLTQLVLGLALIFVAVQIPFSIGTGVRIVVFITGLGALLWELASRMRLIGERRTGIE
ncbi:MAG TPA: hypothetical protein VIX89_09350 [Bryobacteraceae bacterium]